MAITKLNSALSKYQTKDLDFKLKTNFNKAIQDPDFKAFLSRIDIKDEELYAYTTKLQKSFKEVKNCANCKGLEYCKNEIPGYRYFVKVNEHKQLDFNYEACPYQVKKNESEAIAKNMVLFDMPKEIREAKMKNIDPSDKNRLKAIKWITNFIDEYQKNNHIKGLYIHGSFGSGKTYLIAALFNEFTRQGMKTAIVYWPEYLRNLKSSFSGNYEEKFNYIKRVPLLLLDDIGAENVSAWGRDEILSSILQFRMQEEMPTFFTSNFSTKDLETHFSISGNKMEKVKARRIMERINRLSEELEIVSENRRR